MTEDKQTETYQIIRLNVIFVTNIIYRSITLNDSTESSCMLCFLLPVPVPMRLTLTSCRLPLRDDDRLDTPESFDCLLLIVCTFVQFNH